MYMESRRVDDTRDNATAVEYSGKLRRQDRWRCELAWQQLRMPFAMGVQGASRVWHRSTWQDWCDVVGALRWMGMRRPDSEVGDVLDWTARGEGKRGKTCADDKDGAAPAVSTADVVALLALLPVNAQRCDTGHMRWKLALSSSSSCCGRAAECAASAPQHLRLHCSAYQHTMKGGPTWLKPPRCALWLWLALAGSGWLWLAPAVVAHPVPVAQRSI